MAVIDFSGFGSEFLVWKSDREFNASLQRQNKITLILTHIQVTIGLIMLFGFNMDMFL